MRRYAAPGLGVVAAFFGLVGLAGAAHLVLLAAVVAAGLAVLDAVSERVAGRVGAATVVLSVAGLTGVVAAAAVRAPLLAPVAALGAVRLPTLLTPEPLLER